jgi:hypothetical protein
MSSKSPSEGETEKIGVVGWVEAIVKDKHGRIKYRFPEAKPEESTREGEGKGGEGGGDDPAPISALPAKTPEFYYRRNVVTDDGIGAIIRLVFAGLTEDKFGYLAIGTGTTPESIYDTALQSELKRKPASVTQMTIVIPGDTARLEAEFSSADGLTGTATISESGIFNADFGGILLARKVFPGIPLDFDAGDSILIRYFVQMFRS